MRKLLPRGIELFALVVPLVLAPLHLWSEYQPATGLDPGGSKTPGVARLIRQLEGRATDFKFRLRGARAPSPQVEIVEIDERGAQKYGLWPWPRDLVAQGIGHLLDAGATVIGTDIAFTDQTADPARPYREVLADLETLDDAPGVQALKTKFAAKAADSPDQVLEAVLKRAGPQLVQGVIAYDESNQKDFSAEKIAEHARLLNGQLVTDIHPTAHTTFPVEKVQGYRERSAQTPLERFATQGNRLGHLNFVPDIDGTIRRTPLLIVLTGPKGLLPSLSRQPAAAHLTAPIEPIVSAGTLTGVTLGERRVPFDELEPFMLINHDGPGDAYPALSMVDVIEGTFDPAAVKGKAVLIGVTLVGSAGDQRVTPFKELEPGIFTHAAVLSNILTGQFLKRPASLQLIEAGLIVLLGALLTVLIPKTRSFALKLGVIAALAALWLLADQWLFAHDVELATVVPISNLLLTSFASVFLGYLSVDREKLQLRDTFRKYLGAEVMEEALQHPEKLQKGEKREMTVLFSDIRGFTTLSERMLPEKLAAFINQYLSPMTAIVFEQQGTLDKYIGDAVMAFWNAPIDQADHALRACKAALEMTRRLEDLKARWRAENYPEFDIGIGINTGPMIVGNMGSDVRVDYTVMGDAVNLGARLEGTNKEYQTQIILGEGTYEKVQGQVVARRLGAVRVKGKRKPVRIYELRGLAPANPKDADAVQQFEIGLEHHVNRRWAEARTCFQAVLSTWPNDPPSLRYLDELTALEQNPPGPGWDGVFVVPHK